jgi:hypothetical protein
MGFRTTMRTQFWPKTTHHPVDNQRSRVSLDCVNQRCEVSIMICLMVQLAQTATCKRESRAALHVCLARPQLLRL